MPPIRTTSYESDASSVTIVFMGSFDSFIRISQFLSEVG